MHLTRVEHGMMGSYAIVGAHLSIANGAAWSARLRGTDQVAVAFFGDGATNIGAFHEALNFAAVYQLPVLFVCENNLYMEYTAIGEVTAVRHPAADRAAAYGLEPTVVDGNDADAVYLVAQAAIERARSGEGPSLIETKTYRHGGHSRADPGTYRPAEEVEAWLAHDPIPMYHQRLLRLGVAEERLAEIVTERRRRSTRRPRRPRRRRRRTRPSCGPTCGPTGVAVAQLTYREAVSRGIAQEMRATRRWCSSARTSPVPAECSRPPPGCSTSSARCASSTRRSPSRRSSGRRWARR